MSVLKRRTKMLSIRLSEEEYEHLRALCVAQGARSLSDLTRDAVQQLLKTPDGREPGQVEERLQRLDGHMQYLQREVERLTRLMDGATLTSAATNH